MIHNLCSTFRCKELIIPVNSKEQYTRNWVLLLLLQAHQIWCSSQIRPLLCHSNCLHRLTTNRPKPTYWFKALIKRRHSQSKWCNKNKSKRQGYMLLTHFVAQTTHSKTKKRNHCLLRAEKQDRVLTNSAKNHCSKYRNKLSNAS